MKEGRFLLGILGGRVQPQLSKFRPIVGPKITCIIFSYSHTSLQKYAFDLQLPRGQEVVNSPENSASVNDVFDYNGFCIIHLA